MLTTGLSGRVFLWEAVTHCGDTCVHVRHVSWGAVEQRAGEGGRAAEGVPCLRAGGMHEGPVWHTLAHGSGAFTQKQQAFKPCGGVLGCLCACTGLLARRRLRGATEHHPYHPWWRKEERRWRLKKPSPPSAADRPGRKPSCRHWSGRVFFAALLSLPNTGRAKDGRAKGKGRTRVVLSVV